jgi:hypothetical protein
MNGYGPLQRLGLARNDYSIHDGARDVHVSLRKVDVTAFQGEHLVLSQPVEAASRTNDRSRMSRWSYQRLDFSGNEDGWRYAAAGGLKTPLHWHALSRARFSSPPNAMSCMTCAVFGSPRLLVSCSKPHHGALPRQRPRYGLLHKKTWEQTLTNTVQNDDAWHRENADEPTTYRICSYRSAQATWQRSSYPPGREPHPASPHPDQSPLLRRSAAEQSQSG